MQPSALNVTEFKTVWQFQIRERISYPFSSVESDWVDGAELKCLTDAAGKLSCKHPVPVTYLTKLLACEGRNRKKKHDHI